MNLSSAPKFFWYFTGFSILLLSAAFSYVLLQSSSFKLSVSGLYIEVNALRQINADLQQVTVELKEDNLKHQSLPSLERLYVQPQLSSMTEDKEMSLSLKRTRGYTKQLDEIDQMLLKTASRLKAIQQQ